MISKILERIVYNKLYNHLITNKLLAKSQFGFRKEHSTIDAVTNFVGEVLKGFNQNMVCLAIFVDLRKAFDSVKHTTLLEKLKHF